MSDDLRSQIAVTLGRKTTDELLAIWVTNDRMEWSNDAFEAIGTFWNSASPMLPAQPDPPAPQPDRAAPALGHAALFAQKAAQPQGAAVFYRPADVLALIGWLEKLAPYAIGATILADLPALFGLHQIIGAYFTGRAAASSITLLITVVVGALALVLPCWLVYFALKSAAAILRMLLETEFNSRSNPGATVETPVGCARLIAGCVHPGLPTQAAPYPSNRAQPEQVIACGGQRMRGGVGL